MYVSESCMLRRESVAGWSIRGSALKSFSQGTKVQKAKIGNEQCLEETLIIQMIGDQRYD